MIDVTLVYDEATLETAKTLATEMLAAGTDRHPLWIRRRVGEFFDEVRAERVDIARWGEPFFVKAIAALKLACSLHDMPTVDRDVGRLLNS